MPPSGVPNVVAPPTAQKAPPLAGKAQSALSRGLRHHHAGQWQQAVSAYDEALALDPHALAALVNKGAALRRLGRLAEAVACYWQAVGIDPANGQAWCNAGNALLELGRHEEARAVLQIAVRRAPEMAEAWLASGLLRQKGKQPAAAATCFRRAVAHAPQDPIVRLRLADHLAQLGDLEGAVEEFAAARELAPDDPAVQAGMGQALIGLGRLEQARACLQQAVSLQPNGSDLHPGLARLFLLTGQWAAGWRHYESRRCLPGWKSPKMAGPEWDGADPAGKSILVYAEAGLGDTLQFARYLPLLAARGASVHLICAPSLLRLLRAIPGLASLQAGWRTLPSYDAHIPLLSLPLHVGTERDTIPADVPYLSAPVLSAPPPVPLGTRVKAGLAWAGGADAAAAIALERLMPVAGVPGATIFSLQTGPRAADLGKVAHPALIADVSATLKDFAEMAALVDQMDLVITADGPVAHLAGALGKPVWVLIPAVPDWRWMVGREDSPWYPTMRLFRQTKAGDWEPAVRRVTEELAKMVAAGSLPEREKAEIVVCSVFSKEVHHGDTEKEKEDKSPISSPCLRGETSTPRFHMTAPRAFLADPGIRFLVQRERSGVGYEYATRSFVDAHLESGDLFIDVGAHWGIMSLQAVTHPAGTIRALAIEPSPRNVPFLHQWLQQNGVTESVEVIAAAASNKAGRGYLRPESTMGHRLIAADDGDIPVVTIDRLLADRPHLAECRVIVKIDVEGNEPEVIAGMADLLTSGRVAAIIWERGLEYDRPEGQKRLIDLRAGFDALGFTAWRFPSEDEAGPLSPFVEDGKTRGNIFELAPGTMPRASYGHPRPPGPRQPADSALDAALRARALFQESVPVAAADNIKEALLLYAQAGALDGTLGDLFNNLGVLLRKAGYQAAATASYRRVLALHPTKAGPLSNLGNSLREQGHVGEAKALARAAMALKPADSGILYNAALVYRDSGRLERALVLLDRALVLDPANHDCRWDRALVLLQKGDYANGFPAYEARWSLARARAHNISLPVWDGSPLQGRAIFLKDEQGFGDVLQFARFIPEVKRRGAGKVVLECQPELMRLMALAPGVDAVVPRARAIPACDVYAPLLSLAGLFGTVLETLPKQNPYLHAPEPSRRLPDDGKMRVGVVWAGKPTPRDRSCPLEELLPLFGDPRLNVFSLQTGPRADDLKRLGGEALITDLAPLLEDFAETAAMLTQLDVLITVDTAIVHLAGALGVPTFLLLRKVSDWRWFDRGSSSPWYPSVTLFRQMTHDRWEEPLREIAKELRIFAEQKTAAR